MMTKDETIERTEVELWRLIELAHKEGLNYWEILSLMPDLLKDLICKADVEFWLNQR